MSSSVTSNVSESGEVFDAVIIGAGFSGLCMAIQLKNKGIHNILLLEKSDKLGGTWRDNTYPGAACDIPANLYSFSFELKLDWSSNFPPQEEILRYMNEVAEKYQIPQHIRFSQEVCEARFNESALHWEVSVEDKITSKKSRLSARILISGCGQLNRPFTPAIPGLESFSGKSFHSATWDHDVDLEGKSIAVVGNAASAIQIIPEIAPLANALTVFQRSANWIAAKVKRDVQGGGKSLIKQSRMMLKLDRLWLFMSHELKFLLLRKGGLFEKLSEKTFIQRIEREIGDPVLRKKLIPDYAVGCKRILLSSNYYQALGRDNVNVNNCGIKEITEEGVIDNEGRCTPADILIFATGFKSTSFLAPMAIYGIAEQSLQKKWQDGAEAYQGVAVHGFPNLFLLYGPNTNLGHNSIVFMIENQVRFIMKCIEHFQLHKQTAVDVNEESMKSYNEILQKELSESVWVTGCSNWYMTKSGKVVNNWSKSSTAYKRMMKRFSPGDFTEIQNCV